jgi:uncharacterized 2Fe-2S/4Fe-4S cluster protein (DUF4445 family)
MMEKAGLVEAAASDKAFKLIIEGSKRVLPCYSNKSLLAALTESEVFIEANCAGRGTCGKCKIQVASGQVADLDGKAAMHVGGNTYLACQSYPLTDVIITINQSVAGGKGIVSLGIEADGQPLLKKVAVKLRYPTVEKHYSLQEMLCQAMEDKQITTASGVLKQLADLAESRPELITVVSVADEIVAIEVGDTSGTSFGVAFDIGTTTVAGFLVDVNAQKIIATFSENNPQAAFGADVISRIGTAATQAGLASLALAIRECLNRIIFKLCDAARVPITNIYAVTIAGNATMTHLLMELSPTSLAAKPFAALFKSIEPFSPDEININISQVGKILLLPGIASFIGADTTAAMLAVNQDELLATGLLVDLGTNGEMVIGNRDQLFACSTAAGPAFEGAHIRDGMRASVGAIESVVITDEVLCTIIGGGNPRGICGSGIVKAVAELITKKIITATGRFNYRIADTLPPDLARRLKRRDNQWEFVLVEGEKSATGVDISITQSDVRQIQLVKSAICSGIEILLAKVAAGEKMPVFLAGALGNYIDIDSALVLGLLPGFSREQIISVGNAAGVGAVKALLSKRNFERCHNISRTVHYIELAAEPEFQALFLRNLQFAEV